jgi:thioredoxin reductase
LAACDVVVVGAGPYGLSTAAHLLAKGLHVEVFGKPLELWRDHMPAGMCLRSHWWATNLSEPTGMLGFGQYLNRSHIRADSYPLPSQAFIDYGLWFQSQAVPRVDDTYVSSIARLGDRFLVTLLDGRQCLAESVVVATGLLPFANRMSLLGGGADLPSRFVSHSADHSSFGRFAGETVVVVGAGQSALESAALLAEAGATVHVVSRRQIRWLEPDHVDERGLLQRVAAPRNAIAPGWKNLALERLPYLFYRASQCRKDRWNDSYYLSAGSDWLRPRVAGKVALHADTTIVRTEDAGTHLRVALSSGRIVEAGHVLSATGYRAGLSRLPILDALLRADIGADNDVATLSSSFESSVPGLYFVGYMTVRAFGPLYRFVAGATPTARQVAAAIRRRHRSGGLATALRASEREGRHVWTPGQRRLRAGAARSLDEPSEFAGS